MDKFIVIRKATMGMLGTYYPDNYIGTFDTLEEAQEELKQSDAGQYVIYKATEVSNVSVEIERKVFSHTKEEL